MATVPLAEPQVQNRPVGLTPQSNYAPAGAFGSSKIAAAGAGLGQAGDQLGALALKIQAQDNERAAKDADVAYSKQVRLILYGDGTAENPGFKNLQGEHALAANSKVQAALDKARTDILGGLTNERQQQMFGDVSSVRLESALGDVANHSADQRRIANTNSSNARIAEARNDAIADPTQIEKSLAITKAEIAGQAEDNGWDKDVAQVQLNAETTKIHAAIIAKMVDVDPIGAAAYYKKYGDQIDGGAKPAIEKVLNEGVILGQAQKVADDVFAKYPNNPAAGLAEIKKLGLDPKLRDKALDEYLKEGSVARMAIEQARSDQTYADSQEAKSILKTAYTELDNIAAATGNFADSEAAFAAANEIEDVKVRDKVIGLVKEQIGVQNVIIDQATQMANNQEAKSILLKTAYTELDNIAAATGNFADSEAAFAAANEIEDVKVRDKVIGLVKEQIGVQNAIIDQAMQMANNQYTIQDREQRKRERDATDHAFEMANQGIMPDANTIAQMDPYKVEAAKERARKVLTHEPDVTNWTYYNDVMAMGPADLVNVSLEEAQANLLHEQFVQVQARVTAALQNRLDPDNPASPQKLFEGFARSIGLSSSKSGDPKTYGRLQSMFFTEVSNIEAQTKKKMTADEMNDLLHKLGDEQVLQEHWYGDVTARPIDEIPAADRDKARAALIGAGIQNPSDYQIAEYYIRSKKKSLQGQ